MQKSFANRLDVENVMKPKQIAITIAPALRPSVGK